jgi:hypothetical protein
MSSPFSILRSTARRLSFFVGWQPAKNLSGVSSNEIADALEKGMLHYHCLYFTGFTKQDIQRMKRIRGVCVWKHNTLTSLFH